MTIRLAACFGAAFLIGCSDGGEGAGPGNTLVFADRQARQCESDGITVEASALVLINAGIDVIESTCGHRTGVAFPAVCGGPTSDILIHEMRTVNVGDAAALGFADVSTLVNAAAGTGYVALDCTDRAPVPTP